MNQTVLFLSVVTAVAALSGCSAGGASDGPGDLNGGAANGANGNAGGQGGLLYGGTGSTSGGGDTSQGGLGPIGRTDEPDGGCPRVVQKAEKRLGGKADIIWVIDNSGSMATEAAGIQQNMNFFSDFIVKTGIDVHVVAVASGPGLNIFGIQTPPYGICIAPPLGSGQACPNDTNPPLYTHILQEVDSHNALEQLMSTYPQWQAAIRPDSAKTFVVVSDDEANPTPTAADFRAFFDQNFAGSVWRFSGVFCKAAALNCANISVTYATLVDQTGGIYTDMANPDWNAVFQKLGEGIVADAKPVDCEWTIPPVPAGGTFNPDKVNVEYTPSTGAVETIYAVDDSTQCQDPLGGWFFDDNTNPTRVIACPASCTKMQADQGAQVDVVFGCDKKRIPAR